MDLENLNSIDDAKDLLEKMDLDHQMETEKIKEEKEELEQKIEMMEKIIDELQQRAFKNFINTPRKPLETQQAKPEPKQKSLDEILLGDD